MEKYLGVKLIEAEPAYKMQDGTILTVNQHRKNCEENNKIFSPPTGTIEYGYKVKYEDGYISWSPEKVFEKAYRSISGLTFGLAIEAMNKGFKVKVPEWKGYWFKKAGMVKVMTAEGEELDTPHFQQYIFRGDWQIIN